ncbi:MAG: M23 family metallopeptidase [Acidimicrobiia bacterium]|nr:M23 family metallopeptidase [Acidimicrobiia bacterium]
MTTSIQRFALGAITAAVLTAGMVLPMPHAEAVVLPGATQFVIKVFPNKSTNVQFSDTWGASRSGGRRHTGTDIMSPKGTWVVAVDDGIVERLGWNRLSGWSVMIRHADGWTSHYLHLNNDTAGTDDGEGGEETAFAEGLEVGSFVKAGEVIGFVGDSGNAEDSGSHTHFELHVDGKKVNPYPFLEAALDRRVRASEILRTIQ